MPLPTKLELKRTVLRREGSDVLATKWDSSDEDDEAKEEEPARLDPVSSRRRWVAVVVVVLLSLSSSVRGQVFAWSRMVTWVLGLVFAVFLAPELTGQALSWVITEVAMYGRVEIVFKGIRIVPWVAIDDGAGDECMEPCVARPKTCFIPGHTVADDTSSVGSSRHQHRSKRKSWPRRMLTWQMKSDQHQEHSPMMMQRPTTDEAEEDPSSKDDMLRLMMLRKEKRCTMCLQLVRRLLRSRICLEIRIKEFVFKNPRRYGFCRDRFVTASDVEIAVSAAVEDLLRIRELLTGWSWRPRDQPVRRQRDGGGLTEGVVRDPTTKTWRNRRVLGVLDIDRFDVCDAEIAFERAKKKLNVCAIGEALANGEMQRAAARTSSPEAMAANFVVTQRPTRLRVDVVAARHLDAASGMMHRGDAVGPRSTGRRFKNDRFAAPSCFARILVRGQERRSQTILRSANPSFRYEPSEAFYVDDPSAVIHVGIFEEGKLGDYLIAQFATTLKQLILEPDAVDGGRSALEKNDDDKILDRRGFLPLRDPKWRVFTNVEIAEYGVPMSAGYAICFWLQDYIADYLTDEVDRAEGRPPRANRFQSQDQLVFDIARLFVRKPGGTEPAE